MNASPSSAKISSVQDLGKPRSHEVTNVTVHDLASPVLKDLGLPAGLKALCAQLEQQHRMPIRFQCDEQSGSLASNVEIIVFNAVRELLRNVSRHSHAKNVMVALQRHFGFMELGSVEDDGVGFDSAAQSKGFGPSGGYGLFNIRKRMQHLQGEMLITSAISVAPGSFFWCR